MSARHDTAGLDDGSQIFTVEAAGGAATARTDVGLWGLPAYAPSGRLHAGHAGPMGSYPTVTKLVRIEEGPVVAPLLAELSRKYAGGREIPTEAVSSGYLWLYELAPRG